MAELKSDWKRQIHSLDTREQNEGQRVVRYPSGDKRPIKEKYLTRSSALTTPCNTVLNGPRYFKTVVCWKPPTAKVWSYIGFLGADYRLFPNG
ncbi:MAG: hypothetical protein R2822_08605 [Spirosomataceae bacterium]